MIKIKNLTVSYNENIVVDNITTNINRGDFIALIGPNGSGKTTFVKAMLGIVPKHSGSVTLFNTPVDSFKKWEKIGYVPQRLETPRNFPATVTELLSTMPRNDEVESVLSLSKILNKQYSSLSGGQQQRVLLALALSSDPDLLILDEPESGIDAETRNQFYAYLKRRNQENGTTILIITHDIGTVTSCVKTILCINKTLCCHGPADETERLLRKAFGDQLDIVHHHAH